MALVYPKIYSSMYRKENQMYEVLYKFSLKRLKKFTSTPSSAAIFIIFSEDFEKTLAGAQVKDGMRDCDQDDTYIIALCRLKELCQQCF
jgi:hypothetical protein